MISKYDKVKCKGDGVYIFSIKMDNNIVINKIYIWKGAQHYVCIKKVKTLP